MTGRWDGGGVVHAKATRGGRGRKDGLVSIVRSILVTILARCIPTFRRAGARNTQYFFPDSSSHCGRFQPIVNCAELARLYKHSQSEVRLICYSARRRGSIGRQTTSHQPIIDIKIEFGNPHLRMLRSSCLGWLGNLSSPGSPAFYCQ